MSRISPSDRRHATDTSACGLWERPSPSLYAPAREAVSRIPMAERDLTVEPAAAGRRSVRADSGPPARQAAPDSPLEGDGFEQSVPGTKEPVFVAEGELRDRTVAAKKIRYRWFESISLQRRVRRNQ